MWRGVIRLGMIAIPVRLYVATESHSISFRQLCAEHVSLIRNKRWCLASEHEVPYAEVVRGYEVSEDSDFENVPQPTALPRQAVAETGMIAIARIVFRDREHLCSLNAVKHPIRASTFGSATEDQTLVVPRPVRSPQCNSPEGRRRRMPVVRCLGDRGRFGQGR
jgi:non-homologous end joining protein Ku